MKFPEILKYLRTTHNLNQVEFSKVIGVSRSTIGMYETGKREPDFETLEVIADYFNVSMDYLLGKTDNNSLSVNNNNSIESNEVEEEYLLASRSKDGKRGIEILTKTEYESAKAFIQTLRKNTNDEL